MRRFTVGLVVLAVLIAAVGAAIWLLASRSPRPVIQIGQPTRFIGLDSPLDVTVSGPGGRFSRLDISLEQRGTTLPLFSLASPTGAHVQQEAADRIRISRRVGRHALPQLGEGPVKLVVHAARPVFFGLRQLERVETRELTARFTPPRIASVSTTHFVNHGGAEMVLYRVAPPDAASGVRVGDVQYRGFPASGLDPSLTDPSLRVAFFAVLHDQDRSTPIDLVARDEAGNEGHARLDAKVFPRVFAHGQIPLDEAFLARVVPDIVLHTPELEPVPVSRDDLLATFLRINRDLRRDNAEALRALASKTQPRALWTGPFRQLGNSKVESGFADYRTYMFDGREVDRQVHLGFDLAVTAHAPVLAGNKGVVVYAGFLGIYGNTVVIDHGLGVQSLYGHLSWIGVKEGDAVEKDREIGRTGTTGLAGGDHLHFAVLVGGYPVSPIEWWDPHWIQDRITRKIQEAGGVVH